MKTKIAFMLMAIAMMLGIQSCGHEDPKITINSNDFAFKAVNLTVDNGKLSANGDQSVNTTFNWTVNVVINGETTTISGSSKSDELPVRAGDEIEILFNPTCPEQAEGYITLPDGTSRTLTTTRPSFNWTVPSDFTPGMEIKGECHYETDNYNYNLTGVITLVSLK